MSFSSLSVDQLHDKLQTIKNLTKKPYHKYPEEVSLLIEEAFKRGITLKQIQTLSEMPDPTLRYIKRKIVSDSEKQVIDRSKCKPRVNPNFIRISVDEKSISQENTSDRSRARITMSKEGGLVIELGIDSLTADFLRSLRTLG